MTVQAYSFRQMPRTGSSLSTLKMTLKAAQYRPWYCCPRDLSKGGLATPVWPAKVEPCKGRPMRQDGSKSLESLQTSTSALCNGDCVFQPGLHLPVHQVPEFNEGVNTRGAPPSMVRRASSHPPYSHIQLISRGIRTDRQWRTNFLDRAAFEQTSHIRRSSRVKIAAIMQQLGKRGRSNNL
jgi:hypothetical protein